MENLQQPTESEYVLHRRFDRMGRLVGDQVMLKLFRTHCMIIGLGGVGSWAAESLVRSGVGKITLVDFDEVCITNTNRQIQAVQGMVGRKKVEVLAERLRKINPQAEIITLPEFYNAENSERILSTKPDYILDAIDNLTAKCHLISTCRSQGLKLIVSCGSAAKMDPTQVRLVDLAETSVDPMAAQVRKILRSRYDFPEKLFDVPCVFSTEPPMEPVELKYDKGQGFKCVCPQGQNNLHSCEHRNVIYGTASFVTGTFGLTMASWVIRDVQQDLMKK